LPDRAGIDSITTEFRYDFAGRKWAEVAPDGKTDSTRFDPAGNPVSVWTRRGHAITMEYDSLNRLTRRTVPQAKYGPDARGIPGAAPVCCRSARRRWTDRDDIYPFYPYFPTNAAECSLTLPAEVHEFGYDEDGNLVRADNSVSRVRRRYDLNGTLEVDSLFIRTLDGQPNDPAAFTPHIYVTGHKYDLNGRRVSLSHPTQLAPVQDAVTRYSYDPRTGGLASVTDPLMNRFTFATTSTGSSTALNVLGEPSTSTATIATGAWTCHARRAGGGGGTSGQYPLHVRRAGQAAAQA
jgi:YD repeat-containing protein